jgi:hypothetical protein
MWTDGQRILVLGLAAMAMLFQILDGATAIRMMYESGLHAELNPAGRAVFQHAGPAGLILLKVGMASLALATLTYLGWHGRVVLARNCLAVVVGLGVLGTLSNINLG